MRPTAWEHQSLDRWHDDTKEKDRTHRRREAAEEVAAQLRDAEPEEMSRAEWVAKLARAGQIQTWREAENLLPADSD